MKSINMTEIQKLYEKCGICFENDEGKRKTVNKGTLGNRLNTGSINIKSNQQVRWTSNTQKKFCDTW